MKRIEQTQEGPRLLGGRCTECGHWMVPRRTVCPSCRQARVDEGRLGPWGTVVRWADLQIPSGNIPAPYFVGLVRLREGPLLFTRIGGQPAIGQQVALTASVDEDIYWFDAGERRPEA